MIRRGYRWGTLLLVLVGTAASLREASARPQPGFDETSVVSGTVQSASDQHLVLITDQDRSAVRQSGVRLTFALTPQTQLLWGTQRLAAAELQRGDAVMVRYHEQSGQKVVQAIWALVARAQDLSPTQTAEAGPRPLMRKQGISWMRRAFCRHSPFWTGPSFCSLSSLMHMGAAAMRMRRSA
jgi:hypothetical protein